MRRLTAIILGGLGLITGATAMLADASWLGIVAGLAALAAGVVEHASRARATLEQRAQRAQAALFWRIER